MDPATSGHPASRGGFSVAAIAAPFIGTFVFLILQPERSHAMASGLAGIVPLIFGGAAAASLVLRWRSARSFAALFLVLLLA